MTEYFYRYRPIKAVLDEFHELENQEIYFSITDELNDPMEGFKDLFWSGDEIVLRNFLNHYPVRPPNYQLLRYCSGPVRSKCPKKYGLLGASGTSQSAHPRNLSKNLCGILGGTSGKNIPSAHGRQNDTAAATRANELPAGLTRLRYADCHKRISRTGLVTFPSAGLRGAASGKPKTEFNFDDGKRDENNVVRMPAREDIRGIVCRE